MMHYRRTQPWNDPTFEALYMPSGNIRYVLVNEHSKLLILKISIIILVFDLITGL